jgi:nucleoside-diphosphate-sugar epimerase
MIYGGHQENNIQRLLGAVRRFPIIPAPGGGRQIVQPIYIDEVVECLFVAATTRWAARHVIGLAGKPLSWRTMVQVCAKSIDRRCAVILSRNYGHWLASRFSIKFVQRRLMPASSNVSART